MLHINIYRPMTEHAGFQNGFKFQCVLSFREMWDYLLFILKKP